MSLVSKKIIKQPIEVKRLQNLEGNFGEGIEISWSNGESNKLDSKILREHCPCATCKESKGEINHSSPLTATSGRSLLKVIKHTRSESLDLKQIWPVGNYALGFRWGDGHDSGIYTYELLYSLSLGGGNES